MSSHPYSDDFVAMLEAAPHVAPLSERDVTVYHTLEDALARAQRQGTATELTLATWTAYLVKHRDEIDALTAPAPKLAAALYLAMDLHLSTGESISRAHLIEMFAISDVYDDDKYEDIATIARPIFTALSAITPDVLSVIITQFRDQRHVRNHPQHARELKHLADAFWKSEPELDGLDTLPRAQLIMRLMVVPHERAEDLQDDVPEPSCFVVVRDAQSDAPRAALPWYGAWDEHARMSALRRAILEAILTPHQGQPAVPVAVVAPRDEDVKPLMLKLGIPEIVVLSPSQMP